MARRLLAAQNRKALGPVPVPENPEMFWRRVGPPDPATGCRDWTGGYFSDGYGAVSVKGRTCRAPRVAFALTYGQPAGQVVRHRCDRGACCEPEHLVAGSHAENNADMDERGRRSLHRAKVTPEQVDEIRRRVSAGESAPVVGTEFGLSRSASYALARGTTWRSPVHA